MSLRLPRGFSFFGGGGGSSNERKGGKSSRGGISPTLKISTDKEVYRPGDSVIVTIEIHSPRVAENDAETNSSGFESTISSLLVDSLMFEMKGMEKMDSQWFAMQKSLQGSKQKRGENLFLDCTTPSIVSKAIVSTGSTKIYLVRAELPTVLPPSYRGTTIRYIYYVRSTLRGQWLVLENGHDSESTDNLIQLEARAPLQIWVTQNGSNLLNEGNLTAATAPMDIYWREKDGDSEWARANETSDDYEEGYDSSRDEISSVSSYNPTRGNSDFAFRSSLSLQSMITRVSQTEAQNTGERSSFPSYMPLSQLSVAEVLDDSNGGFSSPQKKATNSSPSFQKKILNPLSRNNDTGATSAPGPVEPLASEGFIRGRSYNIRIDDQVLLRFSPKNSDSVYYFGDVIGGTLNFFHGQGARRCLEVSITLETSEIINQRFVHPSRRSSPTITKVQSDHHEVVADFVQTSFHFSIPMDGPMSFSTPYVSVQWALRFEFFTTPKHVDLTRYEHPLLVQEREKGEWVLPITVHAPLPRQTAHSRNEKAASLETLWVRT